MGPIWRNEGTAGDKLREAVIDLLNEIEKDSTNRERKRVARSLRFQLASPSVVLIDTSRLSLTAEPLLDSKLQASRGVHKDDRMGVQVKFGPRHKEV